MTAQCEDIDFDLKIAEFRINGYAVIEDVLSVETVDRIREAFHTNDGACQDARNRLCRERVGRLAHRLWAPTGHQPLTR